MKMQCTAVLATDDSSKIMYLAIKYQTNWWSNEVLYVAVLLFTVVPEVFIVI